jgi:hypothetical protein
MTPAEKESFDKIVAIAKKGEWQDAEKAALKFAQDQVGQGHPAPQTDDHRLDHKGKPTKGGPKR